MKYVNRHSAHLFKCALLSSFLLMVGCAGTSDKPSAAKTEVKAEVQSTKHYLPLRQYDKDGNQLPFIASPNPYTEITGRIEKEVVVNFIEARKAFKSKNFDSAKNLLNKIVESDKTLAGPWVMLGQIAVIENETTLAEVHFKQAIAVNKLNVNAYLPLAKLQRERGDFITAQNTYAQALAVWKDFPEAHLNLGILYDLYLNDPLQAQQHMEAYQFLTQGKDTQVAQWLDEIRSRTGIQPNLYIGPSNASQIDQSAGDKG